MVILTSCKKEEECAEGSLLWNLICTNCDLSNCGTFCSFDLFVNDKLIQSATVGSSNGGTYVGGANGENLPVGSNSFKIVNVTTGETVKEFDAEIKCAKELGQTPLSTSFTY